MACGGWGGISIKSEWALSGAYHMACLDGMVLRNAGEMVPNDVDFSVPSGLNAGAGPPALPIGR